MMIIILFIIILIHFFIKNIEKYTNYDILRLCTEKCIKYSGDKYNKCNNKCIKKGSVKDKKDKKNIVNNKIGCLKSKDGIKLPLYEYNNKYYYIYDDDLIDYSKLMNKNKKERKKLIKKWYNKLKRAEDETYISNNLEKLDKKKIKSGRCIYTLKRNLNNVKVILGKKGNKCIGNTKCKKYI